MQIGERDPVRLDCEPSGHLACCQLFDDQSDHGADHRAVEHVLGIEGHQGTLGADLQRKHVVSGVEDVPSLSSDVRCTPPSISCS